MEDQMTAGLIGFLKKPQRTGSSQERTSGSFCGWVIYRAFGYGFCLERGWFFLCSAMTFCVQAFGLHTSRE
jgi:hypothetical protein